MVPPADVNRSAIAWKRRKSPSAESFIFRILSTWLLKLVMNKRKPRWQIKYDIHETEPFGNTRFHKVFELAITSIMPKTFLGPSGTNRQRTEIPLFKNFLSDAKKQKAGTLLLGRPYWQDFKHVVHFINLKQLQTTKPKLWPDFFIMIEQVVWTCHGRGMSSGFYICPVWFYTDMYSFPLKKCYMSFLVGSHAASMSVLSSLLPSQTNNALLAEKWNQKNLLNSSYNTGHRHQFTKKLWFFCGKNPNARVSLRASSVSENHRKTKTYLSSCYRLVSSVCP